MLKSRYILGALVLLASSQLAQAQQPVTRTNTVKATATIVAIDSTLRIVTLRTANGEEDSLSVAPDVKRFNELKVGDRINITFMESAVVTLQPPGTAPKPSTVGAGVTPGTGKSPSATASAQLTTTVAVKAIDPAVPSITVTTADGRTVTRKIENKKNLEGIKVGDKLDITYTRAILRSAEPAK
jgi:Cu/Ag efflux protein CusF